MARSDRASGAFRLDQATGVGFHIEVGPAEAIDAFYHPYAYAAGDENTYRVEQDERMIVDD
ncbi:MAG TPA: hypothetical protein VHI55_09940 [Gaiellaceae bacterium]|jgi:hypothetical protein|nr:hypothetical protein [Gaiellaceae bacterium]